MAGSDVKRVAIKKFYVWRTIVFGFYCGILLGLLLGTLFYFTIHLTIGILDDYGLSKNLVTNTDVFFASFFIGLLVVVLVPLFLAILASFYNLFAKIGAPIHCGFLEITPEK